MTSSIVNCGSFKLACATIAIGLHAGSSLALTGDDLFFAELPSVASVSRLPQRIEDAPTSVTVIDRAMIRASGARSLSDVMRLVPGFQTFASSDKQTRVNYHGITDDDFSPRVQVLIDGRSLHSPLFQGGVNWDLLPVAMSDIERIEVVRGSNTVSYGTNAFLGVINIMTVDPMLVSGPSASVSRGNQGVFDYTVRGGLKIDDSTALRMTYRLMRDDGLDETPEDTGVFEWADRNRSRLFEMRLFHQIDPSNDLDIGFSHIAKRSLTGRLDDVTGLPSEGNPLRDLDEQSTAVQLRWRHVRDVNSDWQLRYAFSHDKASSAFTDPRARAIPYNRVDYFGDRSNRHELELTHSRAWKEIKLVAGGSWRHDSMRSRTIMRDRGSVGRNTGRVFANAEWRPNTSFTVNAGASFEYDSFAGRHFAPRASLAWHMAQDHTLRLGYARAWRTASVFDYKAQYLRNPTHANWLGNERLPAERLDSLELAYLGQFTRMRMGLDVRVFAERVDNRLQSRISSGDTFGYSNDPDTVEPVQKLEIRGYEFQWKWQPVDATRFIVGHASIRIDSSNTRRGQELADSPFSNFGAWRQPFYVALARQSAPRRSTSIMWMQALPGGADFSLMWYKVGDIKWTRNTFTPGYERFDLRVAYPFRFGAQSGELSYTAQSLKGAHFEEREQRVVDRRHWVTLRLDF